MPRDVVLPGGVEAVSAQRRYRLESRLREGTQWLVASYRVFDTLAAAQLAARAFEQAHPDQLCCVVATTAARGTP